MSHFKSSFGPTITITDPFTIGCLASFFGVIFLLIGSVLQLSAYSYQHWGVSTKGTIVRCDIQSGTHGHTYHLPVVDFRTRSGEHITFEAVTNNPSCKVGSAINVYYHLDDPQNAHLDSDFTLGWAPAGIGLLSIVIGLILCVRGWRRNIPGKR